MKKTLSDSKNTPENSFLQGIISQAESIFKRKWTEYPTKNDQIETSSDRKDWIIIAQYIMTNAGQDSTILHKAYWHGVPETIEFLKSFNYSVPDSLYEKWSKKPSVSKSVVGRKTLYQILLGIINSFQKKQKNSLNRNDLDTLFGILDPASIYKPKDPLFLFGEVMQHTKTRTVAVLVA